MKRAILALLGMLIVGLPLALASRWVSFPDERDPARPTRFSGLWRIQSEDRIPNGAHAKFDNVYIRDGRIQVVKGRDRLNSTAHTDTAVNALCYYENAAGTVKKLVVKESNDVVTYAVNGTGRTVITAGNVGGADADSLTNEAADCIQVGDTLYMVSTTDGLRKWTGTGNEAAVGTSATPSSVNFSTSSTAGGKTPGLDAVVTAETDNGGPLWGLDNAVCVQGVTNVDDGFVDNETCSGLNASQFTIINATSTTYRVRVTSHSSLLDINSEPSSEDTFTLQGGNTCSGVATRCVICYTGSSCATAQECCSEMDILVTGKQTSASGTLASAPSDPFNEYCVWVSTANGEELFLEGCKSTGTFNLGKPDVALGRPLDTTIDTIAPPSFRYATSWKGILFVAENATIRHTHGPINHPTVTNLDTYWLETDAIILDAAKPIRGMISTSDGILIFTLDQIWQITGFGVDQFKVNLAVNGVGCVSGETIEKDTQGDIICFAGVQGVYKIRTFEQPQDDLLGSLIDQTRVKLIKISSPQITEVFRGDDSQIDLDPATYSSAHAYYDGDRDLYHLYIGEHEFIYDNLNESWSHKPATQMTASVWTKSPNANGAAILADDLGFFWQDWLDYEASTESGTVTGSPTSSTSTTLTDTGATFDTTGDGLKGVYVTVDCAGTLQHRRIRSNTATVLTVETAWTSNPTTSCNYYVGYLTVDILTKQYAFDIMPKITSFHQAAIVYNQAPATQTLFMEVAREKGTVTITSSSPSADLSSNFAKYLALSSQGKWIQMGMRSFVYNTSNTVDPPVDLLAYSFRASTEEGE